MKVFSLLSLGEIWKISTCQGKSNASSPRLVYRAYRHLYHTGVEYCLFDTGIPEPLPDKRNAPHFLYCIISFWSRWEDRFKMKQEIKEKENYISPDLMVFTITLERPVLTGSNDDLGGDVL